MKRILLTLFSTALIALLGLPATAAQSRQASLEPIAAHELQSVTGGRCITKCDDEEDDEEEEEEDVRSVGYEWIQTRQVNGASQQLSYSIVAERSNVYGVDPVNYSFTFSDNCRYQWTSGGAGIAAGFNVSVGRTYYCGQSVRVDGRLQPGFRVKIYKGDMRQVQTVTMSKYEIFSDGSSEPTGVTDTGRKVNYWSRYSDVIAR